MSFDSDEATERAPKGVVSPGAVKQYHEMSSPIRARKVRDPQKFPGALGKHRYVEVNGAVNRSQESPGKARRYSSGDDVDESFTEVATSQRKSSGEHVGGKKSEVFQSVEIQLPKDSARVNESKNQSLRDQFIATDGAQRNSDIKGRRRSSGSPDELQGDITVKHSLSPVVRGGKADVSGAAGSPNRLSSPSDIQPTNFTSRRPDRKPKSGKEDHKHMFDAVLARVGQVERLSSDGETFEIRVDKTQIEVSGEDASTCAVKVPLMRFTQLIQGENPSSKVRLRMSKTEMGDQMDIELSSPDEKSRFTSLLSQLVVGVQDKPRYVYIAFCLNRSSHYKSLDGQCIQEDRKRYHPVYERIETPFRKYM